MSQTAVGGAPYRAPRPRPYRHVLHQHRAALRTAVTLAAVAAALAAGALLRSAPGAADLGWAFAVADAIRLGLPLFAGALVAGPMTAEELASGTYKLAWTQSVTPARWLRAKLGVAAGVLLAVLMPLSALLWWVRAEGGSGPDQPAFAPTTVAYALFAVALGALVGLLVRRTTAAMVLTAALLVLTLLVLQSQPRESFGAQLILVVPLLTGAVVAAAGVAVLLRRACEGNVR